MADIHYTTTRNCDYRDRKGLESIADFVNRDGNMGKLVELLVDRGVLSVTEVFDAFRTSEDYALVHNDY